MMKIVTTILIAMLVLALGAGAFSVSYTHLTLPTILRV